MTQVLWMTTAQGRWLRPGPRCCWRPMSFSYSDPDWTGFYTLEDHPDSTPTLSSFRLGFSHFIPNVFFMKNYVKTRGLQNSSLNVGQSIDLKILFKSMGQRIKIITGILHFCFNTQDRNLICLLATPLFVIFFSKVFMNENHNQHIFPKFVKIMII